MFAVIGIFIAYIMWIRSFVDCLQPEVKSFCQFDTFKASCASSEVIVIATAKYGRMGKNRCISGEGYIGCSTDVVRVIDGACSGRQNCQYRVADLAQIVTPCKQDFTSYLEISYSCLKVALGDNHVCHGPQTALDASGHLSSLAVRRGFASPSCPWLIEGRSGQRVSLSATLYSISGAADSGSSGRCLVYVVIKEKDTVKNKALCGFDRKARAIFTSSGNSIEVYFVIGKPSKTTKDYQEPAFIVTYNVEGCADIVPPTNTVVQRTGDDVVIRCNRTRETWFLTCKHSKWVGESGSCSHSGAALRTTNLFGTEFPLPQGLTVAVVLGMILGVFIGFSSLGILMLYRRRRDRQTAEEMQQQQSYYDSTGHMSGTMRKVTDYHERETTDSAYGHRSYPVHAPGHDFPTRGPQHMYETPSQTDAGPADLETVNIRPGCKLTSGGTFDKQMHFQTDNKGIIKSRDIQLP